MSRRRQSRSTPLLTTPEQRARFFERERRDAATWRRLTKRQRRQPKWQQRAAQLQNAGKVGLILLMAGEDPPELHLRECGAVDPPAAGMPSGLFELDTKETPRLIAGRTPWQSPWGSPWTRPKGER